MTIFEKPVTQVTTYRLKPNCSRRPMEHEGATIDYYLLKSVGYFDHLNAQYIIQRMWFSWHSQVSHN